MMNNRERGELVNMRWLFSAAKEENERRIEEGVLPEVGGEITVLPKRGLIKRTYLRVVK